MPDVVDLRRRIDGCERAVARELLKRLRDAQQQIDVGRETLRRCLAHKIDNYKRGLADIARALQARSPAREIVICRSRFVDLHRRFIALPVRVIESAKQRFVRIDGILRVLGPDATLRRGYSITTDDRGQLIRTVASIRPRMKIRTRVSDGEFGSETL